MKFTVYGSDSQYACSKLLKGYDLYLFKDLTGYAGKINKFDNVGDLQETFFVDERKIFGRRLGGWVFVPHYDDTKKPPQKTLEKVWGTFLRQASKHGFNTLLLGQPDASTTWRGGDV